MTIRFQKVEQVQIRGQVGFQIQAMYRDCSDSFWEPVAHAAVFRDRARAEAFLNRVIKGKPFWEYDWSQWGLPVSNVISNTCAIQSYVNVYSVL